MSFSRPMTLEECSAWLGKLPMLGSSGFGWKPQMNKIGAAVMRETSDNLLKHRAPDGILWRLRHLLPIPTKGDTVPMLQDSSSFQNLTQRIKSRKGQIAAIIHAKTQEGQTSGPWPKMGDYVPMRLLKVERKITKGIVNTKDDLKAARRYREVYGPPLKPLEALIRLSGKFKARKIFEFLTRKDENGPLKTTHKSLTYGYTPGMKWIEDLHGGGTSRKYGKPIPARPILGLNTSMIDFAVKVIGDKLEKYLGES
jgi:hypothetical protein